MFLSKAIYPHFMIRRMILATTVAFAITCLLLSLSAIALGQSFSINMPAMSIIETTEQALPEDSIVTFPGALPKSELIQNESLVVQSMDAPCEEILCNYSSGPQSIELRKNVLGCTACYTVPASDEIWIVSARANTCDPDNISLLKVKKFANNAWQPSSLNDLTEAHRCDKSRSTLVYVHGNQTNYEYGVARGFQFYDNLFIKNSCPRPPVRLVLWLWKSEQELKRLYPDYLVKSKRAVVMGRTLTKTLQAFDDRNIAVTGFSLGAQVIMSSLEQMEPDCDCAGPIIGDSKYQIDLIAPATDPGYICDVINRNVDSSIVGQSTIFVNRKDRVIQAMRLVVRRECPEARDDFVDLAREQHFPLGPMKYFEVSNEVSRKHAIERYTKSPTIQREMHRMLTRIACSTF